MQGNGDDFGFSWVWGRRLQMLTADGTSPDDIKNLTNKVQLIASALQSFRTQHQALVASGKFTEAGLADESAAVGSRIVGEIRRLLDHSTVDEDILRTRTKLQNKAVPDPIDKLYQLLAQQEIRQELQARGITGDDTLSADNAYRDAMSRNDHTTMESLELWPMGSPVSPSLISEGRELRYGAVDPIAARKLVELESFRDSINDMLRDALQELPAMPEDDPIARQSGAEPPDVA